MKTKVKKPSVFSKEYKSPYGTYEGDFGNPSEWAASFQDVWTKTGAEAILKNEKQNAWEILGVTVGSSLDSVKSAFRKIIFKVHPDHGGSHDECRKILAAYASLLEILK